MPVQQLVSKYLQLRGELASSYADERWRSCRLGRIDRLSRELAAVESALEEQGYTENVSGGKAGSANAPTGMTMLSSRPSLG